MSGSNVDSQALATMLDEWQNTYQALPQADRHPRLHPLRLNYYRKAFDAILGSDQPENVLWPLLRTWTLAASALPESDPGYQAWRDAVHQLGLIGAGFSERILALDAFLEQVEETITTWGVNEGA